MQLKNHLIQKKDCFFFLYISIVDAAILIIQPKTQEFVHNRKKLVKTLRETIFTLKIQEGN